METVKFSDVEDKILLIRNEKVILDSDVAVLKFKHTIKRKE